MSAPETSAVPRTNVPTTNRPRLARSAAVLASLAMILAACGDDASTEAGTSGSASSDDASIEEMSFEDLEYRSPIQEFLGFDPQDFSGSDDEEQERYIQMEREVGELVVACMAAEGFEYTPEDPGQYISFEESSEEYAWGSRAWTEHYGFGVSTQMFSQEEVGPDLVGHSYNDEMDGEYVDPNEQYLSALSENEVEAFYTALYGNEPVIDTEGMAEEEINAAYEEAYEDWEPDGCYNTASEEIWSESEEGGDWEALDAFYEEFGDEIDAVYNDFENHPDVATHRDEVQACVEDAGQVYLNGETAWEYFYEKMEGIGPNYDSDPFADAGLDPEAMSDEEIDAFFDQMTTLDDADRAALAEIQAEEVTTAIAVWDCGGSELQEALLFQDLRVEAEEQFLAENADRLAPFENVAGSDG